MGVRTRPDEKGPSAYQPECPRGCGARVAHAFPVSEADRRVQTAYYSCGTSWRYLTKNHGKVMPTDTCELVLVERARDAAELARDAQAIDRGPLWRYMPETAEDADGDQYKPTSEQLRDWIDTEGADHEPFVADAIDQAGLAPSVDWVPYGAARVARETQPTIDDVPGAEQVSTALRWFERRAIDWKVAAGPSGEQLLVLALVNNNDETKEAAR